MRVRRLLPLSFLGAALLAPLVTAQSVAAQAGGTGIGVVIGEPTGLTVRFNRNANNFQVHAAWSFANDGGLNLSGDYLRSGNLADEDFPPFYYGIGARIKFADKSSVGIRIPLGMNYFFKNDPFELFGEVVPIIRIIPDTGVYFGAAAGIRYYLGRGGATGGG
jgi:hypothetical protein